MSRPERANVDPVKAIGRLLEECPGSTGLRRWEVFSDWVEAAAVAMANSVEFRADKWAEREEAYQRIVARQGAQNMTRFAEALVQLVNAFEREPGDHLGAIFMREGFGDDRNGQFFTPYEISKVMAGLTAGHEELRSEVAEHGFITMAEPAVGAGGMVIAFAEAMRAAGLNYQQHLWVDAWDVDQTAAQMTYVQLSLMGIPAVVTRGNTLSREVFWRWPTPAHVLGLWSYRLRKPRGAQEAPEEGREDGVQSPPEKAATMSNMTYTQPGLFDHG